MARKDFYRYRDIVPDFEDFLAALDRPQAPVICTNTLRTTPERLRRWFEVRGLRADPLPWNPRALRLQTGVRPGRTLPFLTGWYHVQEETSLLPVVLLDPRSGERLLDLCAAPGNKTLQAALHMEDQGVLFANDKSRHRLGVLRRNVDRLGVTSVAITAADGANLPKTCGPFDRVLADVPCSCEGTSRRNPEILRRPSVAGSRSSAQRALLRKAVQRCRVGGRIVYSTCTYAPEENEAVVHHILEEFGDQLEVLPARIEGFPGLPGLVEWKGQAFDPRLERALRVYPHLADTGGFFVAVLEKRGIPEEGESTFSAMADQLDRLDPTPWYQDFDERFGIPREVFDAYTFFQTSGRQAALARADLQVPPSPQVRFVGTRFAYLEHRRMTTGATQSFGHHARRNVLDLEPQQLEPFLRGDPFPLPEGKAESPGYLIVRFEDMVLGLGRYYADGNFAGMVPRKWLPHLFDDGQRERQGIAPPLLPLP